MEFDITGKAPGKILWLGGYSVLERPNVGFVTAVDAYVSANVKSIEGGQLIIDVPQLNAHVIGTIDLNSGVVSAEVPKELVLLKTAIEVASRYVAGLGIKLQGMHITTENDPEFSYTVTEGKVAKSGLGSSAAVTVASIGTILAAYGVDASENDALHKLAQVAHSIATGKVGSGFDIAAATHGTILYTRYSPSIVKEFPAAYQNSDLQDLIKKNWDYIIERFGLPKIFNLMFANFIGEGMVTTAAVGSVSKFKEKDPERYKELMDGINSENVKAVQALRAINKNDNIEGNLRLFKDSFNKSRALTKQLGILSEVSIEDDDLTKLIEDSVSNGSFVAKLPGAGGRDAISALTLDSRSRKTLEDAWSKKKEIQILKINVDEKGFRIAPKEEDLVNELLKGNVRTHELSKLVGRESTAAEIRRKYLEMKYGSALKSVSDTVIDYSDATDRNIENMVGAAQVPLSYIELSVDGDYAKKGKTYPIYLATTEGKLIAGMTRGASAINACGGARTKVLNEAMTRSVIIDTDSVRDSSAIIEFVNSEKGRNLLNSEFAKHTRHGELVQVDCYTLGSRVFVIYKVKTKAAMGMNMVTIASSGMTKALVEELGRQGIECRFMSESGNMCADKKPSMINVIRGRGVSVVAEVVISKEVLKERLKAEPEAIVNINYAKNYLGSGLAGSIAHNAHIANVLAAAFIAYGQDPAQVVDGSIAFDDAKLTREGDLYFSVYLPSLEIGTFGGGTRRETQMELLKSTGVYGEGDESGETKLKFAELIASACLAAELNVLAAESTGRLAAAHSNIKR